MCTRRVAWGVLVAAVAAFSGCSHTPPKPRAEESALPLVVRNYGFLDVTIYALLSTSGTEGRVRLGQVSGTSSVIISVRGRGRTPDGSLMLMLHAVGARSSWISPAVRVPEEGMACLDIYSDASGDLSRSVLYAAIGPAADGEPHASNDRADARPDDCSPPEAVSAAVRVGRAPT